MILYVANAPHRTIFIFAWTQRKLGDVAEFKNGMNFDKEAMGHGHPFVNLQNIFGRTVVDTSSLGFAESSEQQRKEYSLLKGDVLFIRSSVKPEGVGEAAIIPHDLIDTTYSGFIIRCRMVDCFDDDFKRFVFSTIPFRNQMLNSATTSANTNINQDSLNKMIIVVPNKSEQTAIGSFFRNLDDIIAATQRKVTLLKQLKAAYLQQMFPQTGEKVPRVRFEGFSGDWEIRTIESFAEVKTGGKDTQDAISDGEYDFYVRSPKIEKINSYSFDGEAILTVGDGVGVGKVFHYVNGKFDYHQRVYKISNFNDVYGLFFYQYFAANFIKESQKYNAKTSVDSVRREMITKMLIPCPTIEEQIIIGDFFHNLDTQITTQSEKTEKLKQLKSAYLQKMFL